MVYKVETENQQKKRINIIRSNRGGEYTLNKFALFYEEYRIIHNVIAPYSP